MSRIFRLRGFLDDATKATLVIHYGGLRIFEGTAGYFVSKILEGECTTPFVLRTENGEMLIGGIAEMSNPIFEMFAVSDAVSCVKKNHDEGLRCSVSPIYARYNNILLLSICPIENTDGGLRNSEKDYEELETFVRDWLHGYPGIFV